MQRRLNIKKLSSDLVFEAEYQAILEYATLQGYNMPSESQNIKNNNKIKWIKDLGISITEDFDLFYSCNQEAGLTDFCRINWSNPSEFELTQSNPSLVPDYVPNFGFKKENGDGFYFNTNFTPSLDASAILDPANTGLMIGLFNMQSTYSTVSRIFGGRHGNNNSQIFLSKNGQSSYLLRLYYPNSDSYPELDFTSATIYLDNNGVSLNRFINGVSVFSNTSAPSGQTTRELLFLAQNNNGSILDTGQCGISFLTLGRSIINNQEEVYEILNETYTP